MFSSSIMAAAQLMANAEACNIMMQHFVALQIVRRKEKATPPTL
jgi:hypothetical protein